MPHTKPNSNSYTYPFTYGFTNGDAYAPYADSNCDSDLHTDYYSNGYIHCNTGTNCNCHPNCDTNAKRDDSTGKGDSNSTRSAYSRTAPLTSSMRKKQTPELANPAYEKTGDYRLDARVMNYIYRSHGRHEIWFRTYTRTEGKGERMG